MSSPFDILLTPTDDTKPHVSSVKLTDTSGRYKLGKATRPPIVHDNGHLERFAKREPTDDDKKEYRKWLAIMEGAEAGCGPLIGNINPLCDFETQPDALAAYRHFMKGKGQPRFVDYERYLKNDPSAATLIYDLVADFQYHAEVIGEDRIAFEITSTEYKIGGPGSFAPYPKTTNWVRTLGGHVLWISGKVKASANKDGEIVFHADLEINMEDRYNFNIDQADISTGIPDLANGLFEVTGLAHQYNNYGKITRSTTWIKRKRGKAKQITGAPTDRSRMPSDNRRLRNKI